MASLDGFDLFAFPLHHLPWLGALRVTVIIVATLVMARMNFHHHLPTTTISLAFAFVTPRPSFASAFAAPRIRALFVASLIVFAFHMTLVHVFPRRPCVFVTFTDC